MENHLPQAQDSPNASLDGRERSIRSADRVYQTVTIAAILLVLGSLWLF
jgi:hypothetical protein